MVAIAQSRDLRSRVIGSVLRMSVDLRGLDERPLDALRELLVADVAKRVVEHVVGGEVRLAVLERGTAAARARRRAAASLLIREPDARVADPGEVTDSLGGSVTLALGPEQEDMLEGSSRLVRVGAVCAQRMGEDYLHCLTDDDPVMLRLALLRFRYSDRADLSVARIHRAAETLQRWRLKTAGWADRPAAPAVDTDGIRAELVRALDTSLALRFLHRVEIDPQYASGSKFETFRDLDRILALDLAHQVGKLRR